MNVSLVELDDPTGVINYILPYKEGGYCSATVGLSNVDLINANFLTNVTSKSINEEDSTPLMDFLLSGRTFNNTFIETVRAWKFNRVDPDEGEYLDLSHLKETMVDLLPRANAVAYMVYAAYGDEVLFKLNSLIRDGISNKDLLSKYPIGLDPVLITTNTHKKVMGWVVTPMDKLNVTLADSIGAALELLSSAFSCKFAMINHGSLVESYMAARLLNA